MLDCSWLSHRWASRSSSARRPASHVSILLVSRGRISLLFFTILSRCRTTAVKINSRSDDCCFALHFSTFFFNMFDKPGTNVTVRQCVDLLFATQGDSFPPNRPDIRESYSLYDSLVFTVELSCLFCFGLLTLFLPPSVYIIIVVLTSTFCTYTLYSLLVDLLG